MVDFGVQVQLLPLQVVDERVLLVDQLIQPLNLLRQHDDFVLEVLHLHLNVLVLVESLLYINYPCLISLDLVVIVPQQVVQPLNLLT